MDRGGAETMVMNYYRNIDRSKVQFDFLVHRDQRGAYDDEIESLGGKIYRLPRLNPWSRNYRVALNRFFEEHTEYRIVHVHQDCMSSVILKVAEHHHIPVRIAHSHSTSQDKNIKYPVKIWYKRSISKYATDLFACGKDAGDWMFAGAPYQIVHNAIDVASYIYDPAKREQIRAKIGVTNHFVVGHVGRFSHPKNHPFLLKIFTALLKQKSDAILVLVGGGDDMPKIQKKAQMLGIADHVRFLGIRSDVGDLMQAMDVFVFPSLYEGLPVTLVEAQTAGLPCVISDKVPEDSILVKSLVSVMKLNDPPEQWSDCMQNCLKMKRQDRSEEVAAAGFDIAQTTKWLEEFYLEHNPRR